MRSLKKLIFDNWVTFETAQCDKVIEKVSSANEESSVGDMHTGTEIRLLDFFTVCEKRIN